MNYREAYGIHASNGILFNHESPIRGETFVTRKITRAVAAIEAGRQSKLYIGNLDAKRDWGHARDYVEGMWLMLQQPTARRLCAGDRREPYRCANSSSRPSPWSAAGSPGAAAAMAEVGVDAASGQVLIEVDTHYFRPTEVDMLIGDAEQGASPDWVGAIGRALRNWSLKWSRATWRNSACGSARCIDRREKMLTWPGRYWSR